MSQYVDGFVFPLPREKLNEYKQLAQEVAEIWKEHGALDYREYIEDDMELAGTASFNDVISSSAGEVLIFGWVQFASREARDQANRKITDDPRVAELMASSNAGFDAERMAYGGFKRLL